MKLAQWSGNAAQQAYIHDTVEKETQHHPRLPRAGDSDKQRQKPGWQSLAEAVIETALREAVGDYSENSKAFTNELSRSEAIAFFETDDCLPWIQLAAKDEADVEVVREMIRKGVRVTI